MLFFGSGLRSRPVTHYRTLQFNLPIEIYLGNHKLFIINAYRDVYIGTRKKNYSSSHGIYADGICLCKNHLKKTQPRVSKDDVCRAKIVLDVLIVFLAGLDSSSLK